MGIFKRTKDIFTANINSWLDQAENPEAMINQIIRELEGTISDLKCSCANKLAEKKTIERRVKDLTEASKRWAERAELAVKEGKDDLAREAIKEKSIVDKKKGQLKDELSTVDADVENNRGQVLKLEDKLVEMVNKKKDLLSRIYRAEEKNSVNKVINKATGVDVIEKFSRFESRIERMEAEAEVFTSNIDSKFEDLEQEKEVDEELEKLKAKLAKKGDK